MREALKRTNLICIICVFCTFCFTVAYSQYTENTSPSYEELILKYQKLDEDHKEIELYEMGQSDYGLPIYLCVVNGANDSILTFQKAKKETTILINNAIHAGEPDGVNACLIWIENWIKEGKKTVDLPVIAIIPAYNVGGMMNRSSCSRANQEGPEEYGFRGSTLNLDLNRDFIKMDSENSYTFSKIFHSLDPDVFVDTHVSNGADYQYTLTYISSVKERMAPDIQKLTYNKLLPELTAKLKKKKWDLFPYVELKGETPDGGIEAFNDLPRYAMGYASLFDAISFTVETHMLKPFPQRVQATKDFIDELIIYTSKNKSEIESSRLSARKYWTDQSHFKFNYSNTLKKDSIEFKGYEHSFPGSEVTGMPRLKYDRSKPYKKFIPYYNEFIALDSIAIPTEIYVGSQEKDIISRLEANKVEFTRITKDTVMYLTSERVMSYNSPVKPYEGHFLHSKIKTQNEKAEIHLKRGDICIKTDQTSRQFILSTLTSRAEDSYFTWNFMDSYLQQKEYFSPYVFEDKAKAILDNDPHLKKELEIIKNMDPNFAGSSWEQMLFIYQHCEFFEPTYNLLPVYFKY